MSLLVTMGVLGSPLGIMTKVFEARHCPPRNTKGLQQCSIDQGHGPLSGRSSGFQSQRVTPVWAAQWPPGSGSQGDHPSGAHSERVTRRPVQMSSHTLRKPGFTRLIASKLRNFAIRLADMRESFGLPIHYIGLCSKR